MMLSKIVWLNKNSAEQLKDIKPIKLWMNINLIYKLLLLKAYHRVFVFLLIYKLIFWYSYFKLERFSVKYLLSIWYDLYFCLDYLSYLMHFIWYMFDCIDHSQKEIGHNMGLLKKENIKCLLISQKFCLKLQLTLKILDSFMLCILSIQSTSLIGH